MNFCPLLITNHLVNRYRLNQARMKYLQRMSCHTKILDWNIEMPPDPPKPEEPEDPKEPEEPPENPEEAKKFKTTKNCTQNWKYSLKKTKESRKTYIVSLSN